jgi:hypothetical protein
LLRRRRSATNQRDGNSEKKQPEHAHDHPSRHCLVCADACPWFQKINVPFALPYESLRPPERMGMLQATVCITQHAGAAFLCKPHFIMFF